MYNLPLSKSASVDKLLKGLHFCIYSLTVHILVRVYNVCIMHISEQTLLYQNLTFGRLSTSVLHQHWVVDTNLEI